MTSEDRCRVTVVGAHRRADLMLPSRAAIAEYVPGLLDLCGVDPADDTFPPAWSLATGTARAFPPSMSLVEAGVTDGTTLYLRDAAAGELDDPVVTDIEELVAAANQRGLRWDARVRAVVALLVGLALVVGGLAALAARPDPPPVAGVVALGIGIGCALLGRHALRRRWPLPGPLIVTLGLSVGPFVVLAVALLPPARTTVASLVVGVAIAAVIGAVAARLAVPGLAATFAMATSLLSLPVAVGLALSGLDAARSATVVALLGLIVVFSGPQIAGHFVTAAAPSSSVDAVADAESVTALVDQGRWLLTGIVAFGGLAVLASAYVSASTDDPYAIALAAATGGILALRAGQFAVVAVAATALTAAVATLVCVVLLAGGQVVSWLGGPGPVQRWAGPLLLVLVGLVAAATGLVRSFRAAEAVADDAAGLPRRRSGGVEFVTTLLVLCCPLLALGVFGVFGFLLDLGSRL
ncbi:EsaB/YukD family protein [Solwaraspora sp. WMMD791]|uniref:EsaB/YukD family protein n=1 Tax=Solwaraspora sp. WMMD791 TaxID=3016086 RepID=UPI00249B36A8|nr:EsaB/YukD family protein [Solwaraspora sp. WMMD791]WFE27087.1 EsaB/YukD family protein [Solwaraspora sp. WMMD791]